MNGVLAKPFTKEGMLKSVKTHLSHLLKNPPPQPEQGFMIGNMSFINPTMSSGGTPIKMEGSTTPSGNGSTWSPGQMAQGDMDGNFAMVNGQQQFGMPPGGRQFNSSGAVQTDSPPGKRQRMNPAGGGF